MVIQLKRFLVKKNDTFKFYKTLKNNIFVNFPLDDLDMSPFMVTENPLTTEASNIYTLESVVYHNGNSEGGHYLAKRRQINRYREDAWIEANDSKITQITGAYTYKSTL